MPSNSCAQVSPKATLYILSEDRPNQVEVVIQAPLLLLHRQRPRPTRRQQLRTQLVIHSVEWQA